jgi:hypothetical protein
MALPLKVGTANQVAVIGPFLNSTDGVSAVNTTITNNDIKIYTHNNTAAANKNSGGATHIAGGYYHLTYDATDTGALGRMLVSCSMNGALPVWHEYAVVNASVYEALYGSNFLQSDMIKIAGANVSNTTAQLGVNVIQIANNAPANSIIGTVNLANNLAAMGANVLTAAAFNQGAADKVWATAGRTLTGAANITSNNNKLVLHTDDKVLLAGTTHTSAVIPVVSATNNVTGTVATVNAFASNSITAAAFNQQAADKVWATAARTLTASTNFNDPTAAAIADAVWDEAVTGHNDAGKAGAQLWTKVDSILEDTGTDIPGLFTSLESHGDSTWATATGFSTHSAADVWSATNATLGVTYAVITARLYRFLMNKMNITDATGAVALRNEADDGNIATQTITDDDTTTTRTALAWA